MSPTDTGPGNPARVAAEMSLLTDIGSAWTKASVVGRSRGRWRLAAHVAQPTSWGDEEMLGTLAARLAPSADRRVVDRISELLHAAPRISCHTPRRAGRIALAAVSAELSGASARRAAESAGWTVDVEATTDDGRSIAERLAALQGTEVDAWLLSGGFEQGRADQALEMASLVAVARTGSTAPVVWAGASALSGEISGMFEDGAVTVVANPRPSPNSEELDPLRHVLEDLLQQVVEPAGTRQHTPVAFRRAIAELARTSVRRVAGVDLGARYLTWARADENGNAESRVFAAGGLGAARLVGSGGPGRMARWLPIAIDELAVADAIQNLHARPGTIPQTDDELIILHAAIRQLLAQAGADQGVGSDLFDGADLLIGAGRSIAAAPRPAQAAQLLLDGMRPLGVTQLALDAAGILAPLGALDDAEIGEGMGVLRDDLLVPLGTAVVCRGGRPGQVAMRVTIKRTGWPEIGPVELRAGQLQIVPLARGHDAELEIELANGASLGANRHAARVQASATGGVVGVILDARGIPLVLPRRSDDRRTMLAAWRETFLREPRMPVSEPAAAEPRR
ncbi:MAG TPA: glutamate mutase L [Candidatus Limnocylindrales bacterium]|nr:glutamate mutase L [Candidatus Limnocylindrales bacterium]